MEITEQEKAQARRDAGVFDGEYPQTEPAGALDDYPDSEPNGALEDDPIALLKQKYQAGEIDGKILDLAIRKIAEQRVGLTTPPELRWERLIDSIAFGFKEGIRYYFDIKD